MYYNQAGLQFKFLITYKKQALFVIVVTLETWLVSYLILYPNDKPYPYEWRSICL